MKIHTFSSICRRPALTLDDPPCFSAADTVFAQQALRIFRMFDVDNDGKITAAEIVTILAVFAKADTAAEKKEQARFLFDLWDYDGDGKITKKEMREAYKAFNNHPGKTVAARAFTAAMFQHCEGVEGGVITREDFAANDAFVTKLSLAMTDSHFHRFLNKEDFPEMARCLSEAYAERRA